MKKIILSLLIALAVTPSIAQEARFMGIPIKGNIDEFAKKLRSNSSFKKYYEDHQGIILTGNFMETECLFILKSYNGDNLKEVDVKFPTADSWKKLESRYSQLKKRLIDLYGSPVFVEERFVDMSYPSLRFNYVLKGECFYSSEFRISETEGFVRLFIKRFSDRTASVVLRYSNGSWSKDKFKAIMNDLTSDNGETSIVSRANRYLQGYGTYDLPGRTLLGKGLPIPAYSIQEEGRVVVSIEVSPEGKVVKTSIHSRTNTDCKELRESALKAAAKACFNKVNKGKNQVGSIAYFFNQG